MQGVPAKASRGNFLEAINVTLNVLEKHYMDRDLTRTGNSIVMISPSSGVVEVDSKLSGRPRCMSVCVCGERETHTWIHRNTHTHTRTRTHTERH